MNDRELASSPKQPIVQGSSDETPAEEPGVQGIAIFQNALERHFAPEIEIWRNVSKEHRRRHAGQHAKRADAFRQGLELGQKLALQGVAEALAQRPDGQANHAIP